MTPILSINEDDVLTALGAFLLSVVPEGVEVVRGQANRVPAPLSPDYIVVTPTNRQRLALNVQSFDATNAQVATLDRTQSTRLEFQVDIHGAQGADIAQTVATLFRDEYAIAVLAPDVVPLWATDGHQMPFVNAAKQYEDRWVMTLACQVNPTVSTAQQFADRVEVTLIEV